MSKSHLFRIASSTERGLRSIISRCSYNAIRVITAVAADKYACPELATAKPYEEIPKIPTLPFLGSTWVYFPVIGRYKLRKLHEADYDKYKVYGDTLREKFGDMEIVNSFVPQTMEVFYQHEGKYPKRAELSSLKAYRESRKEWYKSPGLIILQGEEWADLRSKTQKHLMKPRAIQAYLHIMQDVARDFVKRALELRDSNKEVPKLMEEMYKWSLESVTYVGLDTRLGCLSGNLASDSDGMKMIKAVQRMFHYMEELETSRGRIQFWNYFSTPMWKKFTEACDVHSEISFKYINRSLEELKKNTDPDKELTLLQSMLMTKGLDVSGAMVMAADMLMAGIDTTSNSTAFLMYQLAKNPQKQEKLYNEIKQLLPNKNDRITPEIFNKLHYLKACLKESMRLNPIVRDIQRVFDHDVVINGYRVPAGVCVSCALQAIYRMEKYFKDADKFIPERWLNKDRDFNPYAYVPFGIGIRSCIGRRIAELEIFCLATEIMRTFRLEYHYEDIGLESRLINCPDKPLRFTLLDR